MKNKKAGHKMTAKKNSGRKFDSDAVILQSLRLIAAPKPEDDLTNEELAAICKSKTQSPELIRHLIECIKGI